MTKYPVRGSKPWDDDLKAYIDDIARVSHVDQTLSSAAPEVSLGNVNEWTVSGSVQVVLPSVNPGAQYTVHVKSGFQNLSWPNGTTVYGETDQQDVWVTLIRGDAGWFVLIPSPPLAGGSGAGLDTGWVTHVAGYPGFGIVTGNAADLHTGWGLGTTELIMIALRRIGNVLHISLSGLTKIETSPGTSLENMFKLPAGITVGNNHAASAQIPYHLAGSGYPLPSGLLSVVVSGTSSTMNVIGFTLDPANPKLPEGATIGRSAGSNVYGSMFSIPINPSSTWGT